MFLTARNQNNIGSERVLQTLLRTNNKNLRNVFISEFFFLGKGEDGLHSAAVEVRRVDKARDDYLNCYCYQTLQGQIDLIN